MPSTSASRMNWCSVLNSSITNVPQRVFLTVFIGSRQHFVEFKPGGQAARRSQEEESTPASIKHEPCGDGRLRPSRKGEAEGPTCTNLGITNPKLQHMQRSC